MPQPASLSSCIQPTPPHPPTPIHSYTPATRPQPQDNAAKRAQEPMLRRTAPRSTPPSALAFLFLLLLSTTTAFLLRVQLPTAHPPTFVSSSGGKATAPFPLRQASLAAKVR